MRRASSVLVAILFAACGGDGPSQPQVSSVAVTPASSTLSAVGATVQLSAQARDAAGASVTGQSATWASDATTVATVSTTGLVTAVAPGTAAITATVAGVAGSAVITVNQPAQACEAPATVSLSAGQSQAFDSNDCFILPAGANGDRYRVVVTRPDSAGASSVADVTLHVTGIGVTAAPVGSAAPSSPQTGPTLRLDRGLMEAVAVSRTTEAFHRELRAREAGLFAEAAAGTARLAPATRAAGPLMASAASAERITIDTSTPNSCTAGTGPKATAFLVFENDDVAIYQDSVQRANAPISIGHAQQMGTYYSAYAKDMINAYFGQISDIDGNGKIVVFASPTVGSGIAAFVWSGDFFTTESCPASNEMELIFFNASVISAMGGESPNYQALETLAHEAKHVVSLRRRIDASQAAGAGRFHATWIEEGTAEIAGGMSSRIAWAATGGPPVGAKVTRSDLGANGVNVTPENYGILLRLVRSLWYLDSQPNGLVVTPSGADTNHSLYGSGWHFHRWLGDAYGNAALPQADSSLFRALTDSTAGQGTNGLRQQTGKAFRELFREYATAVALHGTGAPEGPLNFTSYDFISATNVLADQPEGEYPWPVTTSGLGPSKTFRTADYTGKLGPTGIRVHDLVSNGTGTGAQIHLDMDVPGEMLVVRIR